jgi:hypothetical protein
VKQWTSESVMRPATTQKRAFDRRSVTIPARLTWKDQRGATRFASVIARNVSEFGVYVECQSAVSIPMYRLVYFQFERDVRESDGVPATLRQGRTLSAVYRITAPTTAGTRQGLALRMMIDPKRIAAAAPAAQTLARASA